MIGPCSYPAASLHHGHTLPMARAGELLQLPQGPALAPPGDHQGKGTKAPEHPSCPPDLLEQQGETEQGLRCNTSLWKALRMEHCRWKECFIGTELPSGHSSA